MIHEESKIEKSFTDDELFEASVKIVKSLPKDGPIKTDVEKKLKFYALFKQATIGKNNLKKPSFFKIIEKLKWNAWKNLESLSSEQAKIMYNKELRNEFIKLYQSEDKSLLNHLDFLKNLDEKTIRIFLWDIFEEIPTKFEKEIIQLRDKYFPNSSLTKKDYETPFRN